MNTMSLFIAVIILSFITFLLLISTFVLHRRLTALLKGENGRSLEKVIHDLVNNLAEVEKKVKEEEIKLSALITETETHTRAPQMIRYKALESNNSNQSFSIALIDGHGNGSVLTSLHIRDRVTIYAKKILTWKSDLELTDEEKNALALAHGEKVR